MWLGRLSSSSGDQAAPPLVAVKMFRPECEIVSIDREIAALSALEADHVIRLLDTASDRHGRPCLVLPKLDPGGLARLLTGPAVLTPGHLVTLLVPIARAVESLHSAGIAHGGLRAGKVLFDDVGAPMLLSGGTTTVLDPMPAPMLRQRSELLGEDRHRLGMLATTLMARVRDDGTDALAPMADWLGLEPWSNSDFANELIERAFDLGSPQPLPLSREIDGVEASDVGTPIRPVEASTRGSGPSRRDPETEPKVRRPRTATWSHRLGHASARMIGAISTVRPRFAVLGAACVLAIAATSVIVITGPVDAGAGAGADTVSSEQSPASPSVPVPELEDEEHHAEQTDAAVTAIVGDDPIAAARALLTWREECIRRRSPECLASAVQADSAAWDSDTAHIAGLRSGARTPTPFWDERMSVSLVDVMGAAVLLRVDLPETDADGESTTPQTATASVLLIRTEAGWRIRDVFSD